MSDGVTHVTAQDVMVDGRYVRQRCAWCGAILLDEDLQQVQVLADDPRPVGAFPTGKLLRVTGENPKSYWVLEDQTTLPEDSCMRLDPAATQ